MIYPHEKTTQPMAKFVVFICIPNILNPKEYMDKNYIVY